MMQKERELKIGKWFSMWIDKNCKGIEELFCFDAVYVESWGPKYIGIKAIKHWFDEWNTRGSVKTWDIKQFFHKDEQTIVEWYFCNEMDDGRKEEFDGLSLIQWENGKICFLKEYGCNINNYIIVHGILERQEYNDHIRAVCSPEVQVWEQALLEQGILCKHCYIFLWTLFSGRVKFCTLT